MESLDIKKSFLNIYAGCRVLVTGNTGFKGSWLCRWLETLGAQVIGYSLSPHTSPNHHDLLNVANHTIMGDIRDTDALQRARAASPHTDGLPLMTAMF